NFTPFRVSIGITTIWTSSIVFNLFALKYKDIIDQFSQYISFAAVSLTLLVYLSTIGYMKFVKTEFRRSIPSAVIRTAMSSFLLCTVPCGSSVTTNCAWLKPHQMSTKNYMKK
ncbi:hypothetical protein PMAYCL1PPCAC_27315, partial [Pristionchus mayeri]